MRRSTRESAHPRPVKRIQLDENHSKVRILLLLLTLVIAAAAFVYALNGLLGNDGGWQQIEADSAAGIGCNQDLIFSYNLGQGGMTATAAKKQLTRLYSDACVRIYQLFDSSEKYDGISNICFINENPGTILTVDPLLYNAFEVFEKAGSRALYNGPVYSDYASLFASQSDNEAYPFDPLQNPEEAAWFAELLRFINQDEHIHLTLLGNNRIRLDVSEEYLTFAKENGITNFIDFFAMKNAFCIDALTTILAEKGYTAYSIASLDGFSKVAGKTEDTVNFRLYQNNAGHAVTAGEYHTFAPCSYVFLSTYRIDLDRYTRIMDDASLRWSWIDQSSGLCAAISDEMAAASHVTGCGELLIRMIPLFTGDATEKPEDTVIIRAKDAEWKLF